ncbi:MAG: hypothetical protein RLZZ244_1527 [Verrucomicrobiota bacterium]|jgi:3-methyladenine DNA glycosylase AlkD
MLARDLIQTLAPLASPQHAARFATFFKTGPGEYAHGDEFLGIPVPTQRKLAARFRAMPLGEILLLLDSPVHEHRMMALLLWIEQFQSGSPALRESIASAYVRALPRVNNWDLVDLSAPALLGAFLREQQRPIPQELIASPLLWERRVAMVATHAWVRNGDAREALRVAEALIPDPHDLIQKAVGWTLREVGKHVSPDLLRAFLESHAARMPRTALRVAIERFPAEERLAWRSLRTAPPPRRPLV